MNPYEDIHPFENVPLIPILEMDRDGSRVNEEEQQTNILEFLTLKGNYMLTMYKDQSNLSPSMQNIVEMTGIRMILPEETIKFPYPEVIGHYIQLPTPANVLHCFQGSHRRSKDIADDINQSQNEEPRLELLRYLSDHTSDIPDMSFDVLKSLKLFRQSDNLGNTELVSLEENNNMMGNFPFPMGIEYPHKLIMSEQNELVRRLGGLEIDENRILAGTLDLMLTSSAYSTGDQRKLLVHIKDRPANIKDEVWQKAKELQCIPSSDGKDYRITDLFDPSSKLLQQLFYGDEGIFPDKHFVSENNFEPILNKLGIKREDSVTSKNLLHVARSIHHNCNSENMDSNRVIANAFVTYVLQYPSTMTEEDMEKIRGLKWVPCIADKPDGYPDTLSWFHNKQLLCSPNDVKSITFKNLVGSVASLVSCVLDSSSFSQFYKWAFKPEVELVIQQLELVIESYTACENSDYIRLAKYIFEYLNGQKKQTGFSDHCQIKLTSLRCVPTSNQGFKPIAVTFIKSQTSHINYSLDPYIFELANEMDIFNDMFIDLGVKPVPDFETLANVLKQINDKYNTVTHGNYTVAEVERDMSRVVHILKSVVAMENDKSKLRSLLIPIAIPDQCDITLSFDSVENCTYAPLKHMRTFLQKMIGDDEVIYVHPDINDLAPQLGVTSVTKRVLNPDSILLPWGQSEPLTTSIANCLDDYKDGLTIPKELIQNADDAGASEVCFLFDERTNLEWRDGLIDEGMAEIQGKALWVYNNALFHEKDFESILRLGGKTKLQEKDKIGKFGLGFCSVYNVTDVPCFVSGNNLVMLDPHLYHLGEAVQNNVPGLRVSITDKFLRNFRNQFKPFDKVFGCTMEGAPCTNFKGTLFRLPLRTQKQAERSLIRRVQYTKREVLELIEKIIDTAANMLLFTQNVTKVSVYHLESDSTDPDNDKKLIFSTEKSFLPENIANDWNILKNVVTFSTQNNTNEQLHLPVKMIRIQYEVTENAQVLSCDFKSSKVNQCWLLSWDISGYEGLKCDRNAQNDGAIPIGTVATPVDIEEHQIIELLELDKLPKGFYSKSHVFCFLPLPQTTNLPVHLNGSFIVEQSRKSLVHFNEDDNSNDGISWNKTIFCEAIMGAYIKLLEFIASNISSKSQETNYWKIWPSLNGNLPDVAELTFAIYKYIAEKNPIVFYRKDYHMNTFIKSSIKNTLFLDPEFRNRSDVGQIALDFLLTVNNESVVIMDMAIEVFENFCKANTSIEDRIISKKDFFEKYFLPQINDGYWQKDGMTEKRDKLVLIALADEDLHFLIGTTSCIPAQSSDVLNKPSDLVLENELLGDMFDIQDGRFPLHSFDQYSETLITLGLMVNTISTQLLVDRIYTVTQLSKSNYKTALDRSLAIMKYLIQGIENHNDLGVKIRKIPFLPIMSKPAEWHPELPWKGSEDGNDTRFMCPSEIFSPNDKELIGSIRPVLYSVKSDERVLRLIGIPEVDIENVVDQLEVIGKLEFQSTEGLEDICNRLYTTLNNCLESTEAGRYCLISQLENLKFYRIVLSNSELIQPCKVALYIDGDCTPYLYGMNSRFQRYKQLWQILGVPDRFDFTAYLSVLKQKREDTHEQNITVDEDEVHIIINVLKNICTTLKRECMELTAEDKKELFIPDTARVLRPINDICFDDEYYDLVHENCQLHFIHEEVKNEFGMIEALGIMSKRHLHLSRFPSFGQKEKLVTRIRDLLSSYPLEHSVLNELLQNADDAGATEVHFVLDMRYHGTDHIFGDQWIPFQGPALCVFNDTCFSTKDLKKIQQLGKGSKMNDPSKTGQFGVGFNTVYHLTDVPSFLTRGESTPNGGTFCVFDPHCKYVPKADIDAPGLQINNLLTLKNNYSDVYSTYLQRELSAETGTWFRFPLRTEEMAESSEIRNSAISEKQIKRILDRMKLRMKESLLFLDQVRKISVSYIHGNENELSDTSSTTLSVSPEYETDVLNFTHHVKRQLKSLKSGHEYINSMELKEIRYEAFTNDTSGNIDTWLIVGTFGFLRPSTIPSELIEAYSEGRIHLSPRGGTAKCIKSINTKMKFEVSTHCNKGIAFCFLPLPIETGLPVHINGHFALSQNRSHIFSDKDENDVRDIWNKCIVDHTVGPSYATWLTFAKTVLVHTCSSDKMHLELASFFNTFPIFEDAKGDFWKRLTCATYVEIHDNELNIFPIRHLYVKCTKCSEQPICTPLTWVALNHCDSGCNFPAVFDDLGHYFKTQRRETSPPCTCEEQHNLRTVLINLGMKIICNPLDIFRSINASCKMLGCQKNKEKSKENVDNLEQQMFTKCICANILSPESAVQFLKSWKTHALDKCLLNPTNMDLTDSPFKTIKLLNSVLDFCLQSKNRTIENLIGTPLLVTNNNKLMTIGQDDDLWLSKFCSIFCGSSEFFVHHDQVTVFEEFKDHFKQLDLSFCKELLPTTVDKLLYKQTNPLCWNTTDLFPYEQWLVDFWKYLNLEDNVEGYFDEWCLFPTIWIDGSHKLVPFSLAFTVYYVEANGTSSNHHHNSLQDLMIKLQLPTPKSDICGKKHLQDLAATDGSPQKLLECLYYHLNNIKWEHLDSNECGRLLRYFSDSASCISSSVIDKLKSIPLFVNVWNEPVSLASKNKVLIVKSENMTVYEGLRELCERTETNLISFNPDHEAMYEKLACTLCYPVGKRHRHPLLSVYTMFFLPNFGIITQDARLKHLVFIRNELLQYEDIKLHVCQLEFIQSEDKILRKACDFFSPHKNIIQELCLPSQLPPTPFCEQEWMEFMKIAGMQCEVNAQLFIKFAKEIQLIGLTEKNIRHSELLIKHMFSSKELYEDQLFLSSISSINFIAPLKIPEEYSTICKPHNSNKLLSFKEGVMSRNMGLCWTMLDILPEFDVPTTTNTDVLKHLNVIDNPLDLKLNCVISHVHNVCESLSHKKRKDKKIVHNLMQMFYEYFSTLSKEEKNELKVRLEQTPIIYSIEHDILLPATNVILELPINMEIKPYLVKCSEMYSRYFDLFRILGVSNDVTIVHFFTVSMFIKNVAGILPLTPYEMECIQYVINGVFDSLHKGDSKELTTAENVVLYLPNENGILKASNQLIINDDFRHRDRLGAENCFEFIVDMEHICNFPDSPSLLKRLPERFRPKFLSESVKEVVLHSQNRLTSDLAVTLEAFISGDIFSHVIARLIKTWEMSQRKQVNKDVLDQIQYKLKSLRVLAIAQLETVLCNEGMHINSTVQHRSIFYDRDANIMYVRFKESATDSWILQNSHWISLAIQYICLGKVSKHYIRSMLPYFEASIEELDEVMKEYNIVDIEYEFVDRRWNSVPGQSVPESLYDCLCSEMSEFEPGDHAVYEVCDNISESFDAKNRMYIYVKIVKKISDDSESFPFYLINTGDEGDIDARSHRLYKVVRTSCVSTTEVDTYAEQQIDSSLARSALYQTVEETLVEAWRLGQEEFKIVMRRLILRWHPDKNKNSSFCGDVFMHITAFAKRLQSGEIDVSKINKYRDRGSHQWQEEMKRATDATCGENEEYVFDVGDFADKVRTRNDRQHGNEQDERNYTLPDPQPGRGEVWIRQAKDDMAAAKISLITATDRTYNWVCVQSHQVNITYIVFIYFIFFVCFLEKGFL